MRILLIRPPEINRVWVGIPKFFNTGIFLFPPLGLMQLKAYIEKNSHHKVIIYDSLVWRADYRTVANFVRKVKPDVVGISTFTHSLKDVIETAKAIKEVDKNIHITIGGPHTYSYPEESKYLILSGYIDEVVLGDGEEAFLKLIDSIEKKEVPQHVPGIIFKKNGELKRTGGVNFIQDLDKLPFPERKISHFQVYYTPASYGYLMTTAITSRGCPYQCIFCNTQKKYRARSVENVVDEIEECKNLGFKEIFFIDDTFNITKERVVQISEEILQRGIKIKWGFKARCDNVDKEMLKIAQKAGCIRIHYGVETGEAKGLTTLRKGVTLERVKKTIQDTKKAGIRTIVYFMIGCPHERNISDIVETINFARSLKADYAVFSLFSPYPDTVSYKMGVEKGVLDFTAWEMFIKTFNTDSQLPTCWEEYFSKHQLLKFLKIAHRKFYYNPKRILGNLQNIHTFREFKRILQGGFALIRLELCFNPNSI